MDSPIKLVTEIIDAADDCEVLAQHAEFITARVGVRKYRFVKTRPDLLEVFRRDDWGKYTSLARSWDLGELTTEKLSEKLWTFVTTPPVFYRDIARPECGTLRMLSHYREPEVPYQERLATCDTPAGALARELLAEEDIIVEMVPGKTDPNARVARDPRAVFPAAAIVPDDFIAAEAVQLAFGLPAAGVQAAAFTFGAV